MPSSRKSKSKAVSPSSTSSSSNATPSNSADNRGKLNPEDVCVGAVLWLPARSHVAGDHVLRCKRTGQDLEDGGYDHPVVILNVKQRPLSKDLGDLIVRIALVTTFSDTRLTDYLHPVKKRTPPPSIPIVDKTAHPSLDIPALYLEKDRSLRKQSYIRLQNIFDVPIAALRTYGFGNYSRAYKQRLDEASYEYLMSRLQLEPDIYTPTDCIWETAGSRLAAYVAATKNAVPDPDAIVRGARARAADAVPGSSRPVREHRPRAGPLGTGELLLNPPSHRVTPEQHPLLPSFQYQTPQVHRPPMYHNRMAIGELPRPTPDTSSRREESPVGSKIISFVTTVAFFGFGCFFTRWLWNRYGVSG